MVESKLSVKRIWLDLIYRVEAMKELNAVVRRISRLLSVRVYVAKYKLELCFLWG